MTVTQQQAIPSNPADQSKILAAIKEADASMFRIESERDLVKEIIKDTSEKYDLDKKILRKMIRVYHKNSFAEVASENETFTQIYETIVK